MDDNFLKSKGKDYNPSDQVKFFSCIIEEWRNSFSEEANRSPQLKDSFFEEFAELVEIDGTTEQEKDMKTLLFPAKPKKSDTFLGLLILVGIGYVLWKGFEWVLSFLGGIFNGA